MWIICHLNCVIGFNVPLVTVRRSKTVRIRIGNQRTRYVWSNVIFVLEDWISRQHIDYRTGKYGPGTFTYQAGHNLILAHARAYRLYESEFKPIQQGWPPLITLAFCLLSCFLSSSLSVLFALLCYIFICFLFRLTRQDDRKRRLWLVHFILNGWLWTGKAGITLNINWYDPKDDQTSSRDAAERAMQFLGGWFANPIFGNGEYPAVMRQKVNERHGVTWKNPPTRFHHAKWQILKTTTKK